MFLPPQGNANSTTNRYIYDAALEKDVEVALVVIALLCVPLMLIPKPVFLMLMFKSRQKRVDAGEEHVADESFEGHTVNDFNMSEVLVHQILETIEFVLGTLSHTASYLRLWALSLAHSELSTVFWDMLFAPSMAAGITLLNMPWLSGVGAFCGFAVWFAITVGVILGMESLSAFLHALRLHWVEFQSKFYKGDGIKFIPLDFKKQTLSDDVEKDD